MLFNPRCLQDCLGELSRQTSHQMFLQPTNNWPCLQMKPGKCHQPPLLGTLQISKFQLNPPLTMPPLSTKQLDSLVPIIPTKGWNVRSLAFLGWAEGPEVSTLKPDPLIYDHLFLPA
jgi:hypothetical protein